MVDVDNLQLHLSKELASRDFFAKKETANNNCIITITEIMGIPPKQKCVTLSFRYHRFTDVYGQNGFASAPKVLLRQRGWSPNWSLRKYHQKTSGGISTYEKASSMLSYAGYTNHAVIISWTWPGPVDLEKKIPRIFLRFFVAFPTEPILGLRSCQAVSVFCGSVHHVSPGKFLLRNGDDINPRDPWRAAGWKQLLWGGSWCPFPSVVPIWVMRGQDFCIRNTSLNMAVFAKDLVFCTPGKFKIDTQHNQT